MKTIVKMLLSGIFLKVLLISLAFILISALAWYAIGKTTKTEVPKAARQNGIKPSSITQDRTYKIDDEMIENVDKELENLGIDKKSIGLTDELLEKFYKAEVITSFPDLRLRSQRDSERIFDKRQLQGCIQIKRRYEEKNDSNQVAEKSSVMEYMTFQDFQDILAKFGYYLEDSNGNKSSEKQVYKAENEVKIKYEELLRDYFTLDEENNLIIATLSSTKVVKKYNAYAQEEMPRDEEDENSTPKTQDSSYTFNIGIEKIPYQEAVEQYSMRMELLMSLLMVSQNSGFCEAVADLAKDFEIVYEIRDNVTTKVTTEKYDYISHFYVKKEANFEYEVEVPAKNNSTTNNSNQSSNNNSSTQNNNNNRTQSNNSNGTTNRSEAYDRINNQPTVTNRRVVLQEVEKDPVLLVDDEGKVTRPAQNPNSGNGNQGNDGEDDENPSENQDTPSDEPKPTIEKKSETRTKSGIWIKGRNKDNPYTTTTTTYINNKITSSVTEVKNWIIDAKIQYEAQKSNNETNDLIGLAYEEKDQSGWTVPEPNDINLEEYKDVEDFHSLLDGLNYDNVPNNSEKKDEKTQVKELRVEGEETTFINIVEEEIKYVKTNSQIEHHEERFLSLLKVDPSTNTFNMNNNSANTKLIKYKDEDGRTFSPEDNILSATEVLFDYLSSTGYEEIMRYMLYIYTGKNYGIIEFDFYAAYEPQEFRKVQNKIYGGTLEEKVWFALKDLGFSDIAVAGAMGNIKYESAGFSLTAVEGGSGDGIGLIQWSKGRRVQLEAYANSKEVPWQDEDTQIEFLIAEISGQGPAVEHATVRKAGYITEEGPENKKTYSDWANATTIEEATGAFMRFFESPLKNESESIRCRYAKEYYERFKDLVRGGGEFTFNYGNIEENYVIATFTSSITGRTFVSVNQGKIAGWSDSCNRAAQMSVCSGYFNGTTQELLNNIKQAPDATISNNGCPTYRKLYEECGLRYRYEQTDEMKDKNSISAETIRNQIQKGGYLIVYLKGSDAGHSGKSQYDKKWANSMHWVAILGYRVNDGYEEIAVTDSGHKNTGWHPIDEFDGMVDRLLLIDEN